MNGLPEWSDPRALALWLGVPLSTVYKWNYSGEGPAYHRIGKRALYRRADIEAWLATRKSA